MTATNHALTGATIATLVRQPYLAIPLAFLSHFFCDALPHFDIKFKFDTKQMWYYLSAEFIAMIGLVIFLLISGTVQPIFWLIVAAIFAMSPDLSWYYYGKKGKVGKMSQIDPLNRLHSKVQWSATKLGIIPEIVWAGMMVSIILK